MFTKNFPVPVGDHEITHANQVVELCRWSATISEAMAVAEKSKNLNLNIAQKYIERFSNDGSLYNYHRARDWLDTASKPENWEN